MKTIHITESRESNLGTNQITLAFNAVCEGRQETVYLTDCAMSDHLDLPDFKLVAAIMIRKLFGLDAKLIWNVHNHAST